MMRITFVAAFAIFASSASAKGLEQLSTQNPETKSEGEDSSSGDSGGSGGSGGSTSSESSGKKEALNKNFLGKAIDEDLGKVLDKNLFFGTSYGWVIAKKSGADISGGGMTDFTVGYKVAMMNKQTTAYATYRYAPVAVSGEIDTRSYRGIWETHFVGTRISYEINQSLNALGTAEVGPAIVHMSSTDGLPADPDHETNGFQLALGGGANWDMDKRGGFTLGPRLSAAFGSFTTIQIGGGFGFLF